MCVCVCVWPLLHVKLSWCLCLAACVRAPSGQLRPKPGSTDRSAEQSAGKPATRRVCALVRCREVPELGCNTSTGSDAAGFAWKPVAWFVRARAWVRGLLRAGSRAFPGQTQLLRQQADRALWTGVCLHNRTTVQPGTQLQWGSSGLLPSRASRRVQRVIARPAATAWLAVPSPARSRAVLACRAAAQGRERQRGWSLLDSPCFPGRAPASTGLARGWLARAAQGSSNRSCHERPEVNLTLRTCGVTTQQAASLAGRGRAAPCDLLEPPCKCYTMQPCCTTDNCKRRATMQCSGHA